MIIPENQFIPTVAAAIPRFNQYPPNPEQESCILQPNTTPLMIVAGPGSGKTTVLVLRALRHVFVDGLLPEQVLLTTFTKKAAKEIRARLIEWGLLLTTYLQQSNLSSSRPLSDIDVNRFVTGTLDSICEDQLTINRLPNTPAPVLLEGFVADARLREVAMFQVGLNAPTKQQPVDNYLAPFGWDGQAPSNWADRLAHLRRFCDRFAHDEVNITTYRSQTPNQSARNHIADVYNSYTQSLQTNYRLDFAMLEQEFLQRLSTNSLGSFTINIKAVLVDEYQDTNPLQEHIYFELIKQTHASFTVVGDDDQSLYRFRGATVELFRDFIARFTSYGTNLPSPTQRNLFRNYRSTPEITTFFTDYIQIDSAFQVARVQPPKPRVAAQLPSKQIPVLGLFRPNPQTLATDLTTLLFDIFRGGGRNVPGVNGATVNIKREPSNGDFGDCVFLGHSVSEFGSGRYGRPSPKFPHLLRQEFESRGESVFNPRGQSLRDIRNVQILLGLMLLCIDGPNTPVGTEQNNLIQQNALRREAKRNLIQWRTEAISFMNSNPSPNTPHSLDSFVNAWQTRTSQTGAPWPQEWPLLDLCFTLLSWLPQLRDKPEGQVHLEAIARCLSQAAGSSSYSLQILSSQVHGPRSVRRAISDAFVPLAEGAVDVDEEIMPHIPRNQLALMTVHQAKGLEYPMVVVDAGVHFKTNHRAQRFRRFPTSPSNITLLEDDLGPSSPVGPLRTGRQAIDRTFDDLTRLYYVAYSRPETVLLLVGLDPQLRHNSSISNVALWRQRDNSWSWAAPYTGRRPSLANNLPLVLI